MILLITTISLAIVGAITMTSLTTLQQAHAAQPTREYCYNFSEGGSVCGFTSAHDCNQARHNDDRATGHCFRNEQVN
jgi:hypothetical protein